MTFEEFSATLNITMGNYPSSYIKDAYLIGYEAGKDSRNRLIKRLEKRADSLMDRCNKLCQFPKLEIKENNSLTTENKQLKEKMTDEVKIQRTYENYELFMSSLAAVKVGDRVRVPAFKVPATVIDGEKKMSFAEIKVDGEYATVYYKDETSLHLVFDRALFKSAVDYNNTKLWNDTQLARYLKRTFSAELTKVLPATDCGLLRMKDLWGKNAKPFFKQGKNRICFDKDEGASVWCWLETPEAASAAIFCHASDSGDCYCGYAGSADSFVRPRFTILI